MILQEINRPVGRFTSSHTDLNAGWFIGLGLVLLLLGIICGAYAFEATIASTMVLGVLMVIGGIVQIVHSFLHNMQKTSARVLNFMIGLCTLIAGILVCDEPVAGSQFITIFISAMMIVGGAFRLVWAFGYQGIPNWWLSVLNAIVTLMIGIMLYATLPWSGLFFLGMLLAVELIFSGISLAFFGFGLRRLQQS